jgi:hypothetical protein
MKLRNLYKSMVLVLTGCMVFQATGSCSSELLNTMVAAITPTLSSAIADAITGAVVGALQQNGA